MRKSIKADLIDRNKQILQMLNRIMEISVNLTDPNRHKLYEPIRSALEFAKKSEQVLTTSIEELSPGEIKVRDLVVSGLSNPRIAETLHVSVKTVKFHLGSIYKKLGIRDRGALIAEYYLAQKRNPYTQTSMTIVNAIQKDPLKDSGPLSLPLGKKG